MKVHTVVVLLSSFILLGGCASTESSTGNYLHPVYADAFPAARSVKLESLAQILTLPEEAKRFLNKIKVTAEQKQTTPLDELIDSLFAEQQLGLSYFSDANSTVAETFRNRQANCLSLTLMTYALARGLGLDASLQDVFIPEYWSRKQGFSLLNGHVNVLLTDTRDPFATPRLVDFDARMQGQQFKSETMSVNRALSMFYNNKGANALVYGNYPVAFRYLSAALKQDDQFTAAWINLGVLYRFAEHYRYAEEAYQKVLQLDAQNLTARENLAILFRLTGRDSMANELAKEVHQLRVANPYYHLIRGDEAFEEGDFNLAHTYYRRAYRLDRTNHLILFALGKTALATGETDDAQAFLERAIKRAEIPADRQRYSAKLAIMSHDYEGQL